jgi:metallo-beta-lactamase class B
VLRFIRSGEYRPGRIVAIVPAMPFRPLAVLAGLLSTLAVGCATGPHDVPLMMRGWNDPFPPFRIAGNIHYVGTNRMALFLVTTPDGHILIDSGFEAGVPRLKQNVEALGFRFEDIKLLLASHAHVDHVQGHALVKQLTRARVVVSAADAPTVSTGGKQEWAYGDLFSWPPCPVDQIIDDGGVIELGGARLTARLTPGHSKGATTWTMTVQEGGRPLAVVFYPSGNVPPGAKLVDNPEYPQAVAAFQGSFALWKSLPCDLFLGAHGEFFDLEKKWKRLQAGEKDAFVDPEGYRKAIADAEKKFQRVVKSQQ